jgi:hypothetical protein
MQGEAVKMKDPDHVELDFNEPLMEDIQEEVRNPESHEDTLKHLFGQR